MSVEIRMPQWGMGMTEGVIAQWYRQEGEYIEAGEPLLEVEGAKATEDIEAPSSGVVGPLAVAEGDTVKVRELLTTLSAAAPPTGEPEPDATGADQAAVAAVASASASAASDPGSGSEGPSRGGFVAAAPLVRRLADRNGIDLASISGSGPRGRVLRADVEQRIAMPAAAPSPAAPEPAPVPTPVAASGPDAASASASADSPLAADRVITPVPQARQFANERLAASIAVPHFFMTVNVDATALLRLRAELNGGDAAKVSVNDLLVRAAAVTLERHPRVNASWHDDGIVSNPVAHIGIAVATENGLLVPVIRNAAQKGIRSIARESRELAGRAHERRLRAADFDGGTFTISNLGMFGIDSFSAIINPPQAAILAVGSTITQPVARDGEVVLAEMVALTLTADHRIVDGADVAPFLRDLAEVIRNPLEIIA